MEQRVARRKRRIDDARSRSAREIADARIGARQRSRERGIGGISAIFGSKHGSDDRGIDGRAALRFERRSERDD